MIKSIKIDRNFKGNEELKKLLTFDYESPLYKPEHMNNYVLGRFYGHPTLSKLDSLEFKPGINLIYARNGSGKSSVIDLITTLSHSKQNYSSYVTNRSVNDLFRKLCSLPLLCKKRIKLDILKLINIEHDGQSVHYFDPEHLVGLSHQGHDFDFDFDFKQGMMTQHGSSGQQILMRLEQFFNNKESEIIYKKKLLADEEIAYNDDSDTEFVKKALLPTIEKGPLTYIMDEPTRSLDTVHESAFWDIIDTMRDKQVIIATHSPFGLFMDDVNYVELEPGYVDECRKWFKGKINLK